MLKLGIPHFKGDSTAALFGNKLIDDVDDVGKDIKNIFSFLVPASMDAINEAFERLLKSELGSSPLSRYVLTARKVESEIIKKLIEGERPDWASISKDLMETAVLSVAEMIELAGGSGLWAKITASNVEALSFSIGLWLGEHLMEALLERHPDWAPAMADELMNAMKASDSFLESLSDKLVAGAGAVDDILGGAWQGLKDLLHNVHDSFARAEITRSPLIIDLDGDGVETLALSRGVHFDHDGNGFAEATGWVAPDDGLVVMDRNHDGRIETGQELFGNETRLDSGKAANGFEALKALDGNGDGVIDSADTAYATLRIWKDANSDGVTDDGELMTLAQAGIARLSVAFSDSAVVDATGNQHRQAGSGVASDGHTLTVEDVWFASDSADTEAVTWVDVDAATAALPDMQGMGNAYSLHQAMARDASGALAGLMRQFAATGTVEARQALLLDIMYRWAGVQDIDPQSRAATQIYGNAIGDARKLAVLEVVLGEDYVGIWCWGQLDPNPHGPAAHILLAAFDKLENCVYATLALQTCYSDLYDAISLKVVDGVVHNDVDGLVDRLRAVYDGGSEAGLVELTDFATCLKSLSDSGLQILSDLRAEGDIGGSGFDRVLATLGLGSAVGTTGNDALSGADDQGDVLLGFSGDDTLYGNGGDDRLAGGAGHDYLVGGSGSDTYVYSRGDDNDIIFNYDSDVQGTHADVIAFAGIAPGEVTIGRNYYDLVLTIAATGETLTVQSFIDGGGLTPYAVDRVEFADGTVWTAADIMAVLNRPSALDDYIFGGAGSDTIDALDGNDIVHGLAGDDSLSGSNGNDWLYGGDGKDAAAGGAGGDFLYGEAGNDTLTGGAGDDTLDGGPGSDIYVYADGDGHDQIYNVIDSGAGTTDAIAFGAGISASGVTLRRFSNDLFVTVNGTVDAIVVSQHFVIGNGVDRMTFADGTVWTRDAIAVLASAATAYADSLFGNDGDNTISGGGGDDAISGAGGLDLLNGDDGADTLSGGSGQDSLAGGTGADYLYGDPGDDRLEGGDGSDSLFGDTGADSLSGGNDNDQAWGGDGGDALSGGAGDDYLSGDAGNDTIHGGAGNDYLIGGYGSDLFLFNPGDGQDTIDPSAYAPYDDSGKIDRLVFGAGIAPAGVAASRQGDSLNLAIGGTSDRVVVLGYFSGANPQLDQIAFADATVWTPAVVGVLVLAATAGDDYIFGGDGADVFNGLGGSDTLFGQDGQDSLMGAGDGDYLYGGAGNDRLDGGDGGDVLYGESGSDTLDGGSDGDQIYGGSDSDSLAGGAGGDGIYGAEGDDTLAGGAGRDYLSGGYGSDVYRFNPGDGQDTIDNYAYLANDAGKIDRLVFGTGIGPGGVTASRHGDGLVLSLAGSTDQVMVMHYFDDPNYRLDQIVFADGTVWTPEAVGPMVLAATAGDDDIVGGDGGDTLAGAGGNDSIQGRGGSDRLSGDAGDDVVYGGDGGDRLGGGDGGDQLYGEAGDDTLAGGTGDDQIFGGDGADTLAGDVGDDWIYGGTGGDALRGGAGSDRLYGSYGSDSYYFNPGDGQDTLDNYAYAPSDDAGKVDRLFLGDGIAPGGVAASRSGTSLLLTLGDTGDSLYLVNYFDDPNYRLEQIVFADGTVWTPVEVGQKVLLPTAGDNYVVGGAGSESLSGGAGNDTIQGNDGNDSLSGDADADWLYGGGDADRVDGGSGDDYMFGEAGSDSLYGGSGEDYVFGGDGDDLLNGGAGNDGLNGNSGSDTLNGGTGNDYMSGGYGSDVYQFNAGDGQDIIDNYAFRPEDIAGKVDRVVFGAGIAPGDVTASRHGSSLWLMIAGTSDRLTATNYFDDANYTLDQVVFANGTVWTPAMVGEMVLIPTDGNDNIVGADSVADLLTGGAGNDTIEGRAGNDALSGDGGDDYLFGGADKDRLSGGDGGDYLTGEAGEDTLDGGNDGDQIYGGDGDDLLTGSAGDDGLNGSAGNDTLNGGTGNDYMSGGYGSDSYLFNPGDGQDTIDNYAYSADDDAGKVDRVVFGVGIAPGDVAASRHGSSLWLTLVGRSDRLTLINYFDDANYRMDQIVFANGMVWTPATVGGMVLIPTDGNDNIVGADSVADLLSGGGGDDTIEGRAGNDTLSGDGGDDYLFGGADRDRLSGGDGWDYLTGEAGDDTLSGGSGNDQLNGGDGGDSLSGDASDDGLYGNNGNDTLAGGKGNDYLSGGNGSDSYLFNAGDGQDTIDNYAYLAYDDAGKVDRLLFGTGILPSAITAARRGDNLVLTLAGTADRLTVSNYFGDANNRLDQIVFADGTAWTVAKVGQLVLLPTAGDDYIVGGGGADSLTGQGGGDTIMGGGGHDVLDGGDGGDVLYGESGNDTLAGGNEFDQLNGGDGNDSLLGGADYDALYGNDGNDVLDGGTGGDYLGGGGGDDTYIVENAGDWVDEGGAGGTDTVKTNLNGYVLAAYVENLILTGGGDISGAGNSLNNVITGNGGRNGLQGGSGDDIIDGGAGADSMAGGQGSDTYSVENAGDVVTELSGEGAADTVKTNLATYTLGVNVENLILVGSGNINGTGNTLNNLMTGNGANNVLIGGAGDDTLAGGAGDDLLNGGTGADRMTGGLGNDTYQLGVADTIVEQANAGIDTVLSSLAGYTLGPTLENVTLIGVAALNANGNGLNNVMTGNGLANILQGGDGNDTIDGAAGNDTLNGGKGADVLHGGLGGDVFVYRALADSPVAAADFVDDYALGDGFDLRLIDANVHVAGDQAFHLVSAFSHHEAELVLSYDAGSNRTTVMMDANGDAKADMAIWLAGHITSAAGWLM